MTYDSSPEYQKMRVLSNVHEVYIEDYTQSRVSYIIQRTLPSTPTNQTSFQLSRRSATHKIRHYSKVLLNDRVIRVIESQHSLGCTQTLKCKGHGGHTLVFASWLLS
jgi:hypothetical protein